MKEFHSFRLDTVNHRLWGGQERVSLTPKAFDLLRYLVEHGDRLVTRNGLIGRCPRNAVVLIEQFRRRYNEHRPHSSLGYRTPIEARWASILREKNEKTRSEMSPALSL